MLAAHPPHLEDEGFRHDGGKILYLGVIAKEEAPPPKPLHFVIDTMQHLPYVSG